MFKYPSLHIFPLSSVFIIFLLTYPHTSIAQNGLTHGTQTCNCIDLILQIMGRSQWKIDIS